MCFDRERKNTGHIKKNHLISKCFKSTAVHRCGCIKTRTVRKSFTCLLVGSITTVTAVTPDKLTQVWDKFDYYMDICDRDTYSLLKSEWFFLIRPVFSGLMLLPGYSHTGTTPTFNGFFSLSFLVSTASMASLAPRNSMPDERSSKKVLKFATSPNVSEPRMVSVRQRGWERVIYVNNRIWMNLERHTQKTGLGKKNTSVRCLPDPCNCGNKWLTGWD